MKLNERLVEAARSFIRERFPDEVWAGAAAMYTEEGKILVSTSPGTVNASVELCHEVGAICEAYKLGQRITATVCISRDDKGRFQVLAPCGVCQERLMYWGDAIEAAVPDDQDSTKWQVKTLTELQPYYWRKPFMK